MFTCSNDKVMKKTLKWVFIILVIVVAIVILAGMYKFNYLANQGGYNVDGNKIEIGN